MGVISYCLAGVAIAVSSVPAYSQGEPLTELDLESLMSLDVQATSVMKRAESVADTPASIYVLTAGQIHRAGVTTLTEALSLIPGLFYRELNNAQKVVGVRSGPYNIIPNLMVMIDGRYFYSPVIPTILWEHVGIQIRDIERIELIRGSAGNLWSSKAASGTINIITKHTIDTLGSELTLGTGNQIESLANFRYGGLFGDGGSFRVSLKGMEIDRSGALYQDAYDGQSLHDLSTRIDYAFSDDLSLMFKASQMDTDIERITSTTSPVTYQNRPMQDITRTSYSNMMLRLDERISASLSHMLQITNSVGDFRSKNLINGEQELFNINYAMNSEFDRHKLDWGLEYQHNRIDLVDRPELRQLSVGLDKLENYGAFIQDEFALIPGKTSVISAVRMDKDQLTGWEYQPSLRILHKLSPENSVWAGVSRSVTTPALYWVDFSALYHSPIPGVPMYFVGNPDFDTETFDNYELGYRGQFESVEIDLSLYRIESDNALELKIDTVGSFPAISRINQRVVNEASTVSLGGELLINLQPSTSWSLQLGLAYLDYEAEGAVKLYSDSLQKQLSIRSDYQLSQALNTYVKVSYVNSFHSDYMDDNEIFTTFDAGITWQVTPELELGLFGQNLFDPGHVEYQTYIASVDYSTELQRSVFARAVLSF